MPDREKVIKVLEGSYKNSVLRHNGELVTVTEILALLKAQEAVKPTWKNGYPLCGECGFKLHWIIEQNNYCPECGRKVKWV